MHYLRRGLKHSPLQIWGNGKWSATATLIDVVLCIRGVYVIVNWLVSSLFRTGNHIKLPHSDCTTMHTDVKPLSKTRTMVRLASDVQSMHSLSDYK